MKKFFLSLVVAMIGTTATFAQNTLVATLTHGEDITMYYGIYALRDAMNAAASGDVINLSGGAFQAVDINKAVTLRGTGIDDANPTYLVYNFTINIPTEDTSMLSMEGMRCTGTITMDGTFDNAQYIKCFFSKIVYNESATIKNVMYANCKINDSSSSGYPRGFCLKGGACSVQFVNCFVNELDNRYDSEIVAINSIVKGFEQNPSAPWYSTLKHIQFINCIIIADSRSQWPSGTIATNCVSVNSNAANIFSNFSANSGCQGATFENVFKSFRGYYSDSQNYELTDEAKTTFLGTDGTQVGLYGGMMPYTSTPSYPQITKMNVANKTTADGKLSVDIEVSAVE